MRKLLNREDCRAKQDLPNLPRGIHGLQRYWSQTTLNRREWEGRGETTIQTISKQHTGGVMEKRDQAEWMTDGPIRHLLFKGSHIHGCC